MTIASTPPIPRSTIVERLLRSLSRRRETGFAFVLLVVLLAVNILLNPARFAPAAWGTVIGLAAPLIAASIAATTGVTAASS